jgi:transcriptional regulator with XRE-family HTH domain
MTPFAELLRFFRRRFNLSQADLARLVGLTAAYIGAIEAGRRNPPTEILIAALAQALRLTPEEHRRLAEAAHRSQRVIRLPRNAGPMDYELAADLRGRFGRLHPCQIAAIQKILEMEFLPPTQAGPTTLQQTQLTAEACVP